MRHNVVRDLVCREARAAGMNPEKEKAGFLPNRPNDDGVKPTGGGADQNRRPADVWLPRGTGKTAGRGEALDFACKSGLRRDKWKISAEAPQSLFADYESRKNEYKDTKDHCENKGVGFCPMA